MVHTEIEIAASPEQVRKVFLDFEGWAGMNNALIKSISRLPSSTGPIEKGEKLNVNFNGISTQVTVLENTSGSFKWRGDTFYVISGEHTFLFEPSKTNLGGTRFVNDEIPKRLNTLLMMLLPVTQMFQRLCEDFKTRVERLQGEGAVQSTETAL